MSNTLSALDAIHVSVILEDCIDQVAVLGRIMPHSNSTGKSENNEIVELIELQKSLDARHEQLMSAPKDQETDKLLKEVEEAIRSNTQAINKSFRYNKFVDDAGQKVQQDRQFLSDVLEATLSEIRENRSFNTLVESVTAEKNKKTELQSMVAQEEATRKRIKQLNRAIVEIRKEHKAELQKRDELIAQREGCLLEEEMRQH